MVIDDDPAVRRACARMAPPGCEVGVFAGVKDALARLADVRFDLMILCDLHVIARDPCR